MPYSKDKVPDQIKVLPAGAQAIWIAVANVALGSNSEEVAVKMAWGAVKKKFKKIDDEWVEKESILRVRDIGDPEKFSENIERAMSLVEIKNDISEVDLQEQLSLLEELIDFGIEKGKGVQELIGVRTKLTGQNWWDQIEKETSVSEGKVTDLDRNQHELGVRDIVEAKISGKSFVEGEKRFVPLRMVKPGWSFNGNYWTKESAAQMATRIMEEGSRKLYLDHQMDDSKRRYGRSIKDWVAQAVEAKVVNGIPIVKVEVFSNSDEANALWEKIQKYPEEVGTSVDARVNLKVGTAEGKEGRIVTNVVRLNSLDFVSQPSAGGCVHLVASKMTLDERKIVEDFVSEQIILLEQEMYSLKGMLKNDEERTKWWKLTDALRTVMCKIMKAPEEELSVEDKTKNVQQVLEEFKNEVLSLNLSAVFSYEEKQRKEKEEMSFASLKEFQEKQPELYVSFVKTVTEAVKSELAGSQATEQVKSFEKTISEQKVELEKANTKVRDFEAKEAQQKLFELRDKMITEAKLPVEHVSEEFKASVREALSDERAKAIIEDRKKLVVQIAEAKKTKPSFKKNDGKPAIEGNVTEKDSEFSVSSVLENVGV